MKYEMHVTSSDPIGLNFLENVIKLANMGAVLKEGNLPLLRFPHTCTMVVESDVAPVSSPFIRVFEAESRQEVFTPVAEAEPEVEEVEEASTFSMDADEVEGDSEESEGKEEPEEEEPAGEEETSGEETSTEEPSAPLKQYSKEELDAMEFDTEFRAVCKAAGITGRSRDKMTKEYLAKFE